MSQQEREPGRGAPYDGALHHAVRASREAFDDYLTNLKMHGTPVSPDGQTKPYMPNERTAKDDVDITPDSACPPQHIESLRSVVERLRQLEQRLREEAIEQLQSCIGGNLFEEGYEL